MAACGPCYKIIIIGNIGVGKTSLFHRVLFGKYGDDFRSTIGFDCFEKTVTVHGESIRVIIYLFMYIQCMWRDSHVCMCVCMYIHIQVLLYRVEFFDPVYNWCGYRCVHLVLWMKLAPQWSLTAPNSRNEIQECILSNWRRVWLARVIYIY